MTPAAESVPRPVWLEKSDRSSGKDSGQEGRGEIRRSLNATQSDQHQLRQTTKRKRDEEHKRSLNRQDGGIYQRTEGEMNPGRESRGTDGRREMEERGQWSHPRTTAPQWNVQQVLNQTHCLGLMFIPPSQLEQETATLAVSIIWRVTSIKTHRSPNTVCRCPLI